MAVVLGLAVGVRLWHLFEFARLPWFRALQMDALYHARLAERLVQEGWTVPGPFFRAPLYPFVLALLRATTGEILWSARLVQIALGVVTVHLAHRIALRLFPRVWALAAGVLAALLWISVHYETELLLEPFFTFLSTLLLFLMIRQEGRPGAGQLVVWGILSGLAVITRPNILLFLPVVLLYAAWLGADAPGRPRADHSARQLPASGLRGFLAFVPRPAAFVLAGLLLPVLPVWVHNARQGDAATIVAWQGGINLYIGNNPAANGWSAVAPDMRTDWQGGYEDAINLAQEKSGSSRPLRPSQVSSYWTGQAARFWIEHPSQSLHLLGRKALLFWSNLEIRNNEDPRFYRHSLASLRWLPVSFGLLAPFVLVGLALAWRRGARFRLLVLFVVTWFLSIIPFFVCSRYRLPLAPLLPIFAVACVREGWVLYSARRWARLAAVVTIVAAFFPVVFAHHRDVEAGSFFQSYANMGDAYSELGLLSEAETAYRKAISLDSTYVHSHNNLGRMLEKSGRLAEAETAYRRGLAAHPEHPILRQNLGLILESQRKFEEAEAVFVGLAADYPESPDLALLVGRVQEAAGRTREAAESYQGLLDRKPQSVPARLRLAHLQASSGDTLGALATVEAGLRIAPANSDLRRARSFLRGEKGFGN